jgi:hypothetical protein
MLQIEFKSFSINKTTATSRGDSHSATTVFVFEEFVPPEYRQQLAKEARSKRLLPFIFSLSTKSEPWKPTATLNRRLTLVTFP